MALIKCPECGKEISNKSKQCIHCGYPLDEPIINQNTKYAIYLIDYSYDKIICEQKIKSLLIDCYQIDKFEINTIFQSPIPIKVLDGVNAEYLEYIKKDFSRSGGIIEFKESNYINDIINIRIQQRKESFPLDNLPKCPTCGSENIEKISNTSKATGGFLFGIFSSDVRKTLHCKNCGYKW